MALLPALILAAAPASMAPASVPVGPRVEARVSVRIVKGAAIRWNSQADTPPSAQFTKATIRTADGARQEARLVEFE